MTDSIIGIDCATQPKRMGLARAVRVQGRYSVVELLVCDGDRHPVEIVAGWVGEDDTALLALDAPLGWPIPLGRELAAHAAGDPIMVKGELLFRRLTDRVVAERTGKTPLDVGADRIARTAHSALLFLDHLRRELAEPIPLAWNSRLGERIEAIEVYPAATMLARALSLRGYKKPDALPERARLLESLAASCDCDDVRDVALRSHDCLDAVACVVAGLDFLEGVVVRPGAPDVARREGWIWFRERVPPNANVRSEPVTATDDLTSPPFYHGTRAELKPGDLIEPASPRDREEREATTTYVHLTPNLDAAIWEAELADGEGPGRVYLVEPTGQIEVDAERASHTSPSVPTMAYRSRNPLRVTGEVTEWRLYHGTRADLQPGDLINPGQTPNFGNRDRSTTYVYLTRTLDAATWGAELAAGEGPGRIYVVEPTGPMEDDPNLTDKKFRGNPTKSYRSRDPLRVTGEVTDWRGHSPEALKAMKEGLEQLARLGVEPID